jgi:hypothetical protein
MAKLTKAPVSTTPAGATILSRFDGLKFTSQEAADLFCREFWPGENRIAVNLKGEWKPATSKVNIFGGTFQSSGGAATYGLACGGKGVWTVWRED